MCNALAVASIPRGHGVLPARRPASRSAPPEVQLVEAEVKDAEDLLVVTWRCAGPVERARAGWNLEWWVHFRTAAAGYSFHVGRSADDKPQARWRRERVGELGRPPQWRPTTTPPALAGNEVRLTLCADEFPQWDGGEVLWSAGTRSERAGVDATDTSDTDAVVLRTTPVPESVLRLPPNFPLPPDIGDVTYSEGDKPGWQAYPKQRREEVVDFLLLELPRRDFRAQVLREWTDDRGILKFESTALSFANDAFRGTVTVAQVFTASGYPTDTILTIRHERVEEGKSD